MYIKVAASDEYFQPKLQPNCTRELGLSPLHKVVAALRQICYGESADEADDYVCTGESPALDSLEQFCCSLVSEFEYICLRMPMEEHLKRIPYLYASVGIPGCFGS